jgi:homoserine kinase
MPPQTSENGLPSVRVPASTSNLGPGFDCLGLALRLHLDVRVLGRTSGGRVTVEEHRGEAEHWPADARELVVTAVRRVLGPTADGVRLAADSEIPIARGLGSSGAAVAAGLLIGAALSDAPPSDDELLALGIELEGHPDNVVASLRGGCTLALPEPDAAGAPVVIAPPVHDALRVAVAWPAAQLTTQEARAVLPETVPFADAVENPRRLALLLTGLATADARLLALGIEDRLHVAHRLPLVPGGAAGLAAAREAGAHAATISGSGTALVALASEQRVTDVAAAMEDALRTETGAGTGRALEIVRGAPRVARG